MSQKGNRLMLFAIFLVSALVMEWILRRDEQRASRRADESQCSSEIETRMSADLIALTGSLDSEGRDSEPKTSTLPAA